MTEEEDGMRTGSPKKHRREAVQIYRPGMFKKGVDSTITGEPSTNSKPPEVPRKMRINTSPLGSARSTGRIDQSHRRRSNDTDSVHSYRNDSGSTTPDAMSIASERKNSWGRGGVRVFTRGGARSKERNNDSMSECSVQSFVSSRNERNDRIPSQHQRRDPRYEKDGYNNDYNKPYNSTQSLYNTRLPGGYLDPSQEGRQRTGPLRQNLPTGQQRFNRSGPSNERSSMRAERRAPRRRNDSINSTQSEWPQPTQELHVDTGPETQSQAGDAPLSSVSSNDYFAVCQSLESMGSFNWTEEMEEVERQKQEEEQRHREEEQTKRLQQKLEACKTGIEVQKALAENKGRPIRGIMRINIEDRPPAMASKPTERQRSPNERPPPHPRSNNRKNNRNRRQRRDSGSSSVSGSIVEEDENDDELAPGERTPTDSRPSSSQEQREFYTNEKRPPKERYRPRTEPSDRGAQSSGSRLAGRLTTANGTSMNRIEGRGVYQPPAMRRATDTVGLSSSLKNNRDSDDTMPPKSSMDQTVYSQIAQGEGPQIEKLNRAIGSLLSQVAEKKDDKAAQKLLHLSEKLRKIYLNVLTKDISFTFTKNLEQHLWKQAFHKIIDAMKRGSNSVNSNAKNIRKILLQFIDEAITYYMLLISHLETTFDVSFEMALYWPNGLPNDDFASLLHADSPVSYDGTTQKLALKSLSRHLLCLGDLYRYKSLIEGNEDYSAARAWYLKAALLWPSSGHTYNQLAVVAFYSERVLDEIFFCIRAIGADHPYESAKDRLNGRLAAMRKKVEKYEQLLDSEQGRINTELMEIGINQREHWIMPEKDKHSEEPSTSAANPSQLHRRAVSYLIHTAGLLISKIGMEKFKSVSERAFSQLNMLLCLEEAPISSHQLIQFAIIFIYAVHVTAIKGEDGTFSVQQQYAVDTLISYFGSLLKPVVSEDVKGWFNGNTAISQQALRVLPAISIISHWFQNETAIEIYKDIPLGGLKFCDVTVDTWSYLARISNDLKQAEDLGQLATTHLEDDFNTYIEPETLYVSSFLSVFSRTPQIFGIKYPDQTHSDGSVHVRAHLLLQTAKFLTDSHVECIYYNEEHKKFIKGEAAGQFLPFSRSSEDESLPPENLTREDLIARERERRIVLVVKPTYVVPDTNAIIDHLPLVQRITDSNIYQILIPTIVLDELQGLSKPGIDARSEEVSAQARKALNWLKEKIKMKNANLHTLTTQGSKMPFRILTEDTDDRGIGKVNDDRILQSCVNYVERNPSNCVAGVSIPKGTEAIYSNLVLLSEDRGICIKATSQRVPTRTIQHFVKWSKLPS